MRDSIGPRSAKLLNIGLENLPLRLISQSPSDLNFLLVATPEELAKLRNQLKSMEGVARGLTDTLNMIESRMKKKLAKESENNR